MSLLSHLRAVKSLMTGFIPIISHENVLESFEGLEEAMLEPHESMLTAIWRELTSSVHTISSILGHMECFRVLFNSGLKIGVKTTRNMKFWS